MKGNPQLLLTMESVMFLAWERARPGDCPQCGNLAIWLYDDQSCFCVHCDYKWDKIDIRAPILMDGSGWVAA